MIELRIYRYGVELFRCSELLELDIDGIRYSGVEYYSQEAREMSVSFLYSDTLQNILEGSARTVLAGWHALVIRLFQEGEMIWQGMMKDGGFRLTWLGAGRKLCEIKSIDMLGWILELSEGLDYRLEGRYIDPAKKVCEIITAIIAPHDDRDGYPEAEVNALRQCVGALNWQFAWLDFDYTRWLPYNLYHHELANIRDHQIGGTGWITNVKRFGYFYDGDDLRLIFWQHRKKRRPEYSEVFRRRIWSLEQGAIQLIDSVDWISVSEGELQIPACPPLADMVLGEGNYTLENGVALYSGPGSLRSVEIVPGLYKARDLVAEYLRLLNAVLVSKTYSMHIRNRIGGDDAVKTLSGVLEATLENGDTSPSEISAASLASSAIVDGVNAHYKKLLRDYPHELELKVHASQLEGVKIDDLLQNRLSFDGYEMLPGELSRDYVSGELEIRGRGRRVVSRNF